MTDDYLALLHKYKADPASLLREMTDLQKRAKSGIKQEKVSAKDGVLEVIECYPAIELQVMRLKWEMWEKLSPQTEKATQLELLITDMTD